MSGQSAESGTAGTLSQLVGSLGSALVSGNLSLAQTAYSTLTQGLAGVGFGSASASQSVAGALSVLG
jgi:hypothetical protein